MRKIGILGGTFDPVHCGHLALAVNAQTQFQLNKVLLIPAATSPHKLNSPGITPGRLRLEMVKIAVRDCPGLEASDLELARGGVSYTIDTLIELRKRYQESGFFLILGYDNWRHFSKWRHADRIREMAKILIAFREKETADVECPGVFRIQMPVFPVSSSEVREKIRRGDLESGVLPEGVREFIKEHRLYQP